jgi:hypothetical protein
VFEWLLLLARRRLPVLRETSPVWLPQYALSETRPVQLSGLIALALALGRELSGEAHLCRAREADTACMPSSGQASDCQTSQTATSRARERQVYLQATERRFNGINRCC